MKYLFSLAFVIGSFTAFAQNPVDGTWKGTRDTPNGTFEITYTFKVEGKVLTGVWKTEMGESKLEDGKIDGKKFSYSFSINDMKIDYTGELVKDDEILLSNERGPMTLTRIKP